METWKPVVGWEDSYEVSDQGRVRNSHSGGIRKLSSKVPVYPLIRLWRGGKGKTVAVHRLVATAFLGPCPAGYDVNHKDGDKTNAALANLEYLTRSENIEHSYRVLGQTSKLQKEQVLEIVRRHKGGETGRALAACFGVTAAQVSQIISGRQWGWLTDVVKLGRLR